VLFKVFPATIHIDEKGKAQKVPLIRGWNEAATDDPNQIRLWSELFQDRLKFWGVPCGAVNGIFVLDVDVKPSTENPNRNGLKSLSDMGVQLPSTLVQTTPSGGYHFIYRARPGIHHPNSVNAETGLDTRGDRGWIAWYGNTNGLDITEAPDWMWALSPKKKDSVQPTESNMKVAPEIAEGIIKAALEAIRGAPAGQSNDTLNVESFKIGQLVASGSISREYAFNALYAAAIERGKAPYEAKATINSGLDGGGKNPLVCPFPPPDPSSQVGSILPPMPAPPTRWTPAAFTIEDLHNVHHLRRPQLFQDWSTEDIMITTADGGTGKTTLALFESICLALGDRFLGFDCKQPGARTLFITGEDTDKKLVAALGQIMRQMGLFEEGVDNDERIRKIMASIRIKKDADLTLIAKTRDNFLVPNHDAIRKVLEAVEDFQPKRIVFDPISSFWGSENALNDMNRAVIKFMGMLVERGISVEMINHMGKGSSGQKDMTQFAGRGGSGLPSNSRVSRTLRSIDDVEFLDLTGQPLENGKSAILCNVNKFSDGSPLLNKAFVIVRDGYLFNRRTLAPAKEKELEKAASDIERVMSFVKEERKAGRYPSLNVVVAHFMGAADKISGEGVKRALTSIQYAGHQGEKLRLVQSPDALQTEKVFVLTDYNGQEI
jgi:RecA-family ATPase